MARNQIQVVIDYQNIQGKDQFTARFLVTNPAQKPPEAVFVMDNEMAEWFADFFAPAEFAKAKKEAKEKGEPILVLDKTFVG